jgi:hypothetical protein
MRNRQCSCGVAQIARLLRMTQIASIRAETANKKLSKSSSQNYPNSFSENAKAPVAKGIRRQETIRRTSPGAGRVSCFCYFSAAPVQIGMYPLYCTVFIAP